MFPASIVRVSRASERTVGKSLIILATMLVVSRILEPADGSPRIERNRSVLLLIVLEMGMMCSLVTSAEASGSIAGLRLTVSPKLSISCG